MPLFFLGTREWRNRQTRTVQVRVPVMEWGFNSPLAHDETADPSGSAVFVFPGCGLWPPRVFRAPESPAAVCAGGRRPARVMVLLVAPRVFRAPRGAGLLCGARPLCVPVGGGPPARSPHASLRLGVVDLEARPGPAATHRHRGQALRLEARPGPATAHGNRSLARLFLWVSWGSRVLSFWGARVRVVTNVVNPRCFSCGFLLRCYERRQSEGFFAEVPVEGLCWASFSRKCR